MILFKVPVVYYCCREACEWEVGGVNRLSDFHVFQFAKAEV